MKNTRCYLLTGLALIGGIVVGATFCSASHTKYIPERTPEHPINPLFVNRWSKRAMSGKTVAYVRHGSIRFLNSFEITHHERP